MARIRTPSCVLTCLGLLPPKGMEGFFSDLVLQFYLEDNTTVLRGHQDVSATSFPMDYSGNTWMAETLN